jgi:ribulose-phosphate 3-epimerase
MNQIIPALLVKTETEFRERFALVEGAAPLMQIDVMDGMFVPNESWFDPDLLKELKTNTKFELHLMVEHPENVTVICKGAPHLARIIWHIEADINHTQLIRACHKEGWEAGLAINPGTPEEELSPFVNMIDCIQIMGNEPGFSGKSLEPAMIERAKRLHNLWPAMPLSFDIGISKETIPTLRDAGVTRFAAASAIFGNEDPKAALKDLQNI